jgi:hypothetical protein
MLIFRYIISRILTTLSQLKLALSSFLKYQVDGPSEVNTNTNGIEWSQVTNTNSGFTTFKNTNHPLFSIGEPIEFATENPRIESPNSKLHVVGNADIVDDDIEDSELTNREYSDRIIDGYDSYTPYAPVEQALKDAGFDVLVFVPSMDEEDGLVTCGNVILGGSEMSLGDEYDGMIKIDGWEPDPIHV